MLFPSRAVSHACGHLLVSRLARRTTEKRETTRSLKNENVINSLAVPMLARQLSPPQTPRQVNKRIYKKCKVRTEGLKFFNGKLAESGFVLQKILK